MPAPTTQALVGHPPSNPGGASKSKGHPGFSPQVIPPNKMTIQASVAPLAAYGRLAAYSHPWAQNQG